MSDCEEMLIDAEDRLHWIEDQISSFQHYVYYEESLELFEVEQMQL